ncbi:endopeptidase La [Candidatus Babeliales bacterium]|nr:endopeptidase La [Candidatus Babeliales bacterium]
MNNRIKTSKETIKDTMEKIKKTIERPTLEGSAFEGKQLAMLPVLPLKNVVVLPRSIIPVVVGRDISIKAVEFALKQNKEVFVATQKKTDIEKPTVHDLYQVGVRASILQVARMPNGSIKILIEGIERTKIAGEAPVDDFIGIIPLSLEAIPVTKVSEQKAFARNLYNLFKEYIKYNEKLPADLLSIFKTSKDLDYLTDSIAVQLPLALGERQAILEMTDLRERATRLSAILKEELEILKADKSIRKRIQSQVEKHQKDYYLNEQMRAIQRELGRDDYQQEIEKLRKKAKKVKLSKEAAERVEAECKRLEQMQPTSPESAVSRNYVDWLISVPWDKQTRDSVSIEKAEEILNSSHAGMIKPKERILEFLATKKFAGDKLKRSPIICLVGPPGTGKTSLALSVAKALGREMVRISLGGMRDEAEIRGHRRTYIGAMPGKIVQAMKKAGVANPVIVLDEIDKMAMDFRGDPASAMLEVLDPEQNKAFADYFLEVDYDLSKVMFITTANVSEGIPYPLLDRMEMISLSGYTDKEKLQIGRDFLLPKLYQEHALKKTQVKIPDSILKEILESYTKEAGVRQLEQILAKILRKSIQELQKNKNVKVITVNSKRLEKWLGMPKYRKSDRKFEKEVGLATGLAWTEVGGELLEIEVVVLGGKGSLSLTGQLGEVMQESAQAALSYIRSRANELGLKPSFYSTKDIHVHIPEGAIPKDGPSAGITMGVALISALTKKQIKPKLAMTGEATLRGRVLAVGGLKEKLLAAARFGIETVLVPKENEPDIKEFEKELDKSLKLIYVETMDQVLKHAFVTCPLKSSTRKKVVKKSMKKIAKKKPVKRKTTSKR